MKEEDLRMPVFIYEPDAFDKMIALEGENYRRFKGKESFGVCSFDAFLEEWTRINSHNPEFKNYHPEFGIGVGFNGAIYGWGGWNRFIVLNTGEILLHKGFVEPWHWANIKNARKIGFRIFPIDLKDKRIERI
ncbi:hypothetical protein A2567_00225 [Candidatus Azambacteria bacterium RIFOXYD1_FULL_42_11]|uniref:Uncharacterized protein n=4 Tax=Candidatus Azamiibacteriota TaxID=1752741 RepID=A0A1F5CJL9_9BACT|nr:MAG: hypothetical protein A2567_00225 [Candidatus Azambacteria bacterium RIFOXYD1_FULL_42_11]